MKPLSSTNILNALLPPVSLLLVLTIFLVTSNEIRSLTIDILIFLFCVILVGWIYAVLMGTFDLYYDSKFLYLRGLNTRKKISLSAIRRIRLTNDKVRIMGVASWKYTIEFDSAVAIDDQSIWEIMGSRKLAEFEDTVKQVNSSVIIKHTSF
jgi:predicted membrane protein